jgi:intracellular multiplication protein IcmB
MAYGLYELLKGPARSFCRLECAWGPHTLVADDGSLVSAISVAGLLSGPPEEEGDRVRDYLTEKLRALFESKRHRVKVVFDYDPQGAAYGIERTLLGSAASISACGLDLKAVMGSHRSKLESLLGAESLHWALWTLPKKDPGGKNEQSDGIRPGDLDSHQAALDSLLFALKGAGLRARTLTSGEFARHIRCQVYGDALPEAWKPLFPGDAYPLMHPVLDAIPWISGGGPWALGKGGSGDPGKPGKGDPDQYPMHQPLSSQLFPEDCEVIGGDLLRAGNMLRAPFFMALLPRERRQFAGLFRALARKSPRAPLRMAFCLTPLGLEGMRLKSALSRILSFTSLSNRKIARALDALKLRAESGEALSGISIALDTSVRIGDYPDLPEAARALRRQKAELLSLLSGWGETSFQSVTGDPLLAVAAAIPGLMPHGGPSPRALAPLSDLMGLLPVRPASAWERGPMLFRTPDGKAMPFSPNSAEQPAWVDLGIAPMGAGKSVLLNTLNLAFCTQAGLKRLPLLSIIDVGKGSKGLVDLLRASLPPERRHEAVFRRLRASSEHSINPFDTPLGLRRPLPSHMNFLSNLLCLLATTPGAPGPPKGVPGLLRLAVEAAYRERELAGTPLAKVSGSPALELALEKGLKPDSDSTVWEAVDHLFAKGHPHEALLLQRHAVPTLGDLLSQIRQNPSIKAGYGFKGDGGESPMEHAWRALSEAERDFPQLSVPSSFSLGDARVIALDLDEVAPRGGGAQGRRQTAVMYMLARHACGGRLFLMPEDVARMPSAYQDYHAREIDSIRLDPKRLCYDELHRVTGERALSDQLTSDLETCARESRKWNLSIGLYSQSARDFPEVIMGLATSVYLLGMGTVAGDCDLGELFGLGPTLSKALGRMGKPGPEGSELIAIWKTKEGVSRQRLVNTLGPELLWAFGSTTEDVAVRDSLCRRHGTNAALSILAKRYPSGIKREAERRKEALGTDDTQMDAFSENNDSGVIGEIIKELGDELMGINLGRAAP